MNKLRQATAGLAVAGATLAGGFMSPEMASAQGTVGPSQTVERSNLGLDGSGLPSYSGAPDASNPSATLRFHEGAKAEVTSICDPATGIGTNVLKLTTVARPGFSGAVTWGIDQDGKEFFRQPLGGGRTAVIPNLPSGTFNLGWVEDNDTEGVSIAGKTIFSAVSTLDALQNSGKISANTLDDFRSYPAAIRIKDCVKVEPVTTTTSTTTTLAPKVTTTTTTTSTTVPVTTTTVAKEAPKTKKPSVKKQPELAMSGPRPLGVQTALAAGMVMLGGVLVARSKKRAS